MSDVATIALLHPGEMGSSVGEALTIAGHRVLYASEGRSPETIARATRAGLIDVGQVDELAATPMIISICPPHAARDVAALFPDYRGTYVDANAVSPETAESIREMIESGGGTYVDGGIIGGPPMRSGRTTLHLSGDAAKTVALQLSSEHLTVNVLEHSPTSASALKMAYASWTKGTTALILDARSLARAYGVEADLVAEWGGGEGGSDEAELMVRSRSAAGAAATRGWRWVGEMQEIASTYRSVGLPDGFHLAAAEIYRRSPLDPGAKPSEETVRSVVDAIVQDGSEKS